MRSGVQFSNAAGGSNLKCRFHIKDVLGTRNLEEGELCARIVDFVEERRQVDGEVPHGGQVPAGNRYLLERVGVCIRCSSASAEAIATF